MDAGTASTVQGNPSGNGGFPSWDDCSVELIEAPTDVRWYRDMAFFPVNARPLRGIMRKPRRAAGKKTRWRKG